MKARMSKENKNGFRAIIETEEEYYNILFGNKSVKDEHQDKVTHYEIPAAIFERLIALDRQYMKIMIKLQEKNKGEDAPPNLAYEEFLRRFPDGEK